MKKVLLLALLAASAVSQALDITVYDNTTTTVTAGFSGPASTNLEWGDTMTLTQPGKLSRLGFALFNSTSGGNTGSILTGTYNIKIYNNTVPYAGGAITGALLANIDFSLNFGAGLAAGSYVPILSGDLSGFNLNLPSNVLVVNKFTMTTGTSTRWGGILASNPTIGSSPNTVYLKSTTTPEGLYTITNNPGQFYHRIDVVPEPASMAAIGLGLIGLVARRRRK